MMRATALAAIAGLAAVEVGAQPIDTAGIAECKVSGYAKDPDPRGRHVRSAPRADAPIIGHLAPMVQITKVERTGVTFDIVGFRNGWLLIRNPSPIDGLTFDAAHEADGRGWISARLVSTTLATPIFRAAPSKEAVSIARMDGGANWGPYTVEVMEVHACSGRYIEMTARPPGGKSLRGWAFGPCSAQLTTCDSAGQVE